MGGAIQGGHRRIALTGLLLYAGCPNLQGIPALGSPSPIEFGGVPPGAGVQTRQIVIQNIGGSNLGVLKAAMVKDPDTGLASSQTFSVGQPAPTTLSPGQKAVADVTFTPLANSGFSRGFIQITTDSSYTPQLGIRVSARIDTPPGLPSLTLNFGPVPVQTRKTLSLQITTALAVAPPDMPKPTAPFQLGPSYSDGGLFEQAYSFTPTAAQNYQAGAGTYVPCAGCAPQQLILTGQGIQPLVFEDLDGGILSSFDLGTVVVGVDAGYRIQLFNQWSDQVVLDGLNDASPFSASTSPGPINPGQGVDVVLGFAPTEARFESASLFANYAVGSQALVTAPVTLNGRGISDRCDLSWTPPSIFFGYAPANLTVQQQVTFINHGAFSCTVGNFSIFPGGAAEPFSVPVTASITVPPHDGVVPFIVNFKPAPTLSPIHQRGATLIFDTGDPVKPDGGISLSGSLQLEAYGASAWPKWHHDNGNTGLSPVDTSNTLGVQVWRQIVGVPPGVYLAFLQGPSLDETGAIYQLVDSNLLKLSPIDGSLLGNPLPLQSPAPIVVGGSFSVAGIESTPTIISGSPWLSIAISQGADAGRILTSSGTTLANRGSSAPVAGFVGLGGGFDGGAYVADDQTSSVARLSGGGAVLQRWDLCGGGSVCALETFSGALADDGTSYWTGGSSYAFALAADGTNLWSRSLSGGFSGLTVHTSPALLIAAGVVYAVGAYQRGDAGTIFGSVVYALNQADGSPLWDTPVQLPEYDSSFDSYPIGYSSPALRSDGTVVVGYHDGVYLISPQGQLISVVPDLTGSGVVGSAAIGADGRIYVGTLGGELVAIDDKHCDAGGFCREWVFAPGGVASPVGSSPAIGADGTIYFMAGGQFFAVQ